MKAPHTRLDDDLDGLARRYSGCARDLPRPLMAPAIDVALPPMSRPPVAYLLAPLIDRWPRFTALAALVVLLVLLGLAGDPPPDETPDPAANQGLPAELLADHFAGEPAQPEASR